MKKLYQHNDEVIEAARILRAELLEDAPFGNTDEAMRWVRSTYPQIVALADQTTEVEEQSTGWVQPKIGDAYPSAI